jgi:hypothetical protein
MRYSTSSEGWGAVIVCALSIAMGQPAHTQNASKPLSGPVLTNITPTQPWTHTGVYFNKNDALSVTASGTLNWYTDHCDGKCVSTPDGQKCEFQGFYAPELACWSLIGKVGNSAPFQVGSYFNGATASFLCKCHRLRLGSPKEIKLTKRDD